MESICQFEPSELLVPAPGSALVAAVCMWYLPSRRGIVWSPCMMPPCVAVASAGEIARH
jgi:hypothetical protein